MTFSFFGYKIETLFCMPSLHFAPTGHLFDKCVPCNARQSIPAYLYLEITILEYYKLVHMFTINDKMSTKFFIDLFLIINIK